MIMIMEVMIKLDQCCSIKAVLKKTEDPVVKQDLVEMDR